MRAQAWPPPSRACLVPGEHVWPSWVHDCPQSRRVEVTQCPLPWLNPHLILEDLDLSPLVTPYNINKGMEQ